MVHITNKMPVVPGGQPAAGAGPIVGTLRIARCPDTVQVGRTFPLRGGETTIGRDRGNLVVLDDAGVSGLHARIVMRAGEPFLIDAQSTNGTFLNGTRILEVKLARGDTLLLGATALQYEPSEVP
jgi:pSer/pThr/pTyr-binding forkhead associated (FHA) protein